MTPMNIQHWSLLSTHKFQTLAVIIKVHTVTVSPIFPVCRRPETSFLWFTSPWKTFRYIIWRNYKWYFFGLLLAILIVVFVILFVYAVPVSGTSVLMSCLGVNVIPQCWCHTTVLMSYHSIDVIPVLMSHQCWCHITVLMSYHCISGCVDSATMCGPLWCCSCCSAGCRSGCNVLLNQLYRLYL